MLNYPVILSHRRSTTVSSETYFLYSFVLRNTLSSVLVLEIKLKVSEALQKNLRRATHQQHLLPHQSIFQRHPTILYSFVQLERISAFYSYHTWAPFFFCSFPFLGWLYFLHQRASFEQHRKPLWQLWRLRLMPGKIDNETSRPWLANGGSKVGHIMHYGLFVLRCLKI